jgi:hypothetical protein
MEELSTPRRPKILKLLIIIAVVVFVLGVGVGFYYYVYPRLVSNGEEATEEPVSYFEGPLYYEEVGGTKTLVAVFGAITKVDDSGVVINERDEDYFVSVDNIVGVNIFSSVDKDGEPIFEDFKYQDLSAGMLVGFSLESGYLTVNCETSLF